MAVYIDATVHSCPPVGPMKTAENSLWSSQCEQVLSSIFNMESYSWEVIPMAAANEPGITTTSSDSSHEATDSPSGSNEILASGHGTSMSNHIYIVKLKNNEDHQAVKRRSLRSNGQTRKITLFLRIYGKSTSEMVDRDQETRFSVLISEHGLGPHILGYFNNGRIEEYIRDATTLSSGLDMKLNMAKIAPQLRRLHQIPIDSDSSISRSSSTNQAFIWERMRKWIKTLERMIDSSFDASKSHSPTDDTKVVQKNRFHGRTTTRHPVENIVTTEKLFKLLSALEKQVAESPFLSEAVISLTHGDLQYGNVMKKNDGDILFVDFEYSCLNYQSFDIANHFFEYTCEYKDDDYRMDLGRFPSPEERMQFYLYYFGEDHHLNTNININISDKNSNSNPNFLSRFDGQVMLMLKISHLFWSIWGFIMAVQPASPTFPYLDYARDRMKLFLNEM